MNIVSRALLGSALAVATAFAPAQATDLGTAENNAALTLVGRIPVPNMTGTWDHLTVDLATDRLFASAQEDNQVRVFDLIGRKPLYTITGGFDRPQGLYYVPGTDALARYQRQGRDRCAPSMARLMSPSRSLPSRSGAGHLMDMDPNAKCLYVDHGGVDSNPAASTCHRRQQYLPERIGEVATEYRPAAPCRSSRRAIALVSSSIPSR